MEDSFFTSKNQNKDLGWGGGHHVQSEDQALWNVKSFQRAWQIFKHTLFLYENIHLKIRCFKNRMLGGAYSPSFAVSAS